MIRSFLPHPSPVLSPAPWRIENPLLVGTNSLLLFVSPCRLLPAPVGTERLMIRERFKEPIGGATPGFDSFLRVLSRIASKTGSVWVRAKEIELGFLVDLVLPSLESDLGEKECWKNNKTRRSLNLRCLLKKMEEGFKNWGTKT